MQLRCEKNAKRSRELQKNEKKMRKGMPQEAKRHRKMPTRSATREEKTMENAPRPWGVAPGKRLRQGAPRGSKQVSLAWARKTMGCSHTSGRAYDRTAAARALGSPEEAAGMPPRFKLLLCISCITSTPRNICIALSKELLLRRQSGMMECIEIPGS